MHAAMERALREAAIGAGDHVFAAKHACQPGDALRNQLGMLDDIGGMADDARNQHLPRAELCIFPYLPFVLVTRVGALDDIGADFHLQDQVRDLLEWYVAGMRPGPGAPAHVIPDTVSRQPLD